jgi:RimJ/RimL family protein N-acetyltransferase
MDNIIKIPTYFTGEKINLVPLEREDMPFVMKWINNEGISFYNGARFPISLHEQNTWYERTQNDKSKKKLIICNKDGFKVGMISLFNIDHRNQNAEIGIYVDTAYQGKGYAKEAINILVRFGFNELNMHKLYATILDFNVNSVKLFEAAGFSPEYIKKEVHYTDGRFCDVHVLSVFRK